MKREKAFDSHILEVALKQTDAMCQSSGFDFPHRPTVMAMIEHPMFPEYSTTALRAQAGLNVAERMGFLNQDDLCAVRTHLDNMFTQGEVKPNPEELADQYIEITDYAYETTGHEVTFADHVAALKVAAGMSKVNIG